MRSEKHRHVATDRAGSARGRISVLALVVLLATALPTGTAAAVDEGVDIDEDGYEAGIDCNDSDPSIHPGATDMPGDGIDQDCNGADAATCFVDADHDGYGTSLGDTVLAPDGTCDTADGEAVDYLDCNDSDPLINPGATDIPGDGIDQDCNGTDAVVNTPPVADANGPYLAAVLAVFLVDGNGSSDPDSDPLDYSWSFPDDLNGPTTQLGAIVSFQALATPGIYPVTLTVDDGNGGTDTASTYVVVYDPSAGFVTGGGWIDSPPYAYYPRDLPFFDGSYYELVFPDEPLGFFETAVLVAGMSTDKCASAHLATITSQGEYETVFDLLDGNGATLGGFQDEGVYPPDVGWQWVTGEPFVFEETLDWWQPGEPNDCGSEGCPPASEQRLAMYDDQHYAGGGWNDEPMGLLWSYVVEYEDCDPGPTGKATFGFVSKYKKGASTPTGNTEFQFHAADLNFHSSSYEWLVVTGSDYARFKGTGTINGTGEYKFMIWAGDDEPDTFRIKIWTEDEFGVETVLYDNGPDQTIGGGSIVIHTKKK